MRIQLIDKFLHGIMAYELAAIWPCLINPVFPVIVILPSIFSLHCMNVLNVHGSRADPIAANRLVAVATVIAVNAFIWPLWTPSLGARHRDSSTSRCRLHVMAAGGQTVQVSLTPLHLGEALVDLSHSLLLVLGQTMVDMGRQPQE